MLVAVVVAAVDAATFCFLHSFAITQGVPAIVRTLAARRSLPKNGGATAALSRLSNWRSAGILDLAATIE